MFMGRDQMCVQFVSDRTKVPQSCFKDVNRFYQDLSKPHFASSAEKGRCQ